MIDLIDKTANLIEECCSTLDNYDLVLFEGDERFLTCVEQVKALAVSFGEIGLAESEEQFIERLTDTHKEASKLRKEIDKILPKTRREHVAAVLPKFALS